MMRRPCQILYGVTGLTFVLAGGATLLLSTGLLPAGVRGHIVEIAGSDGHALHIVQEFGSLMVFAGLMSFWAMTHFERSRFFHWALTTFWALFALVHWFDTNGRFEAGLGQVIISLPFVIFGMTGIGRAAYDSALRSR